VKPHWVDKVDPERYPARALADLWQKRLYGNFRVEAWISRKEYGQFRDLHRFLGKWTSFVIEWMTVPAHWRHFAEMIRQQAKLLTVPLVPRIGFLLQQRTRALKIMCEYLRDSGSPAAIRFVAEQDLIARKNLGEASLLLSGDSPELLSKITAANTPAEIHAVFSEIQGGI
jgi:hypothetical protein